MPIAQLSDSLQVLQGCSNVKFKRFLEPNRVARMQHKVAANSSVRIFVIKPETGFAAEVWV
jgi:3-hydroxymyristoyl/3-hydroxydecanoyl-(acyl carrier protein) dehydratase